MLQEELKLSQQRYADVNDEVGFYFTFKTIKPNSPQNHSKSPWNHLQFKIQRILKIGSDFKEILSDFEVILRWFWVIYTNIIQTNLKNTGVCGGQQSANSYFYNFFS